MPIGADGTICGVLIAVAVLDELDLSTHLLGSALEEDGLGLAGNRAQKYDGVGTNHDGCPFICFSWSAVML